MLIGDTLDKAVVLATFLGNRLERSQIVDIACIDLDHAHVGREVVIGRGNGDFLAFAGNHLPGIGLTTGEHMADRGSLPRANREVTAAIAAVDRGNLHGEDIVHITVGYGEGDEAVVVIIGEIDSAVAHSNAVAVPGSREIHRLIATGVDAAVDRVEQLHTGLGVHLKGVAVHILAGGLVGPVGTELRQGCSG